MLIIILVDLKTCECLPVSAALVPEGRPRASFGPASVRDAAAYAGSPWFNHVRMTIITDLHIV